MCIFARNYTRVLPVYPLSIRPSTIANLGKGTAPAFRGEEMDTHRVSGLIKVIQLVSDPGLLSGALLRRPLRPHPRSLTTILPPLPQRREKGLLLRLDVKWELSIQEEEVRPAGYSSHRGRGLLPPPAQLPAQTPRAGSNLRHRLAPWS